MANRVVITGMGAITPVGNDVETFWNSLKEKKTGFGEITYFDTADFKVKLAAQVKDFDLISMMQRSQEEWSRFPSSQWQQPLRPLHSQVSIWKRRIPSA